MSATRPALALAALALLLVAACATGSETQPQRPGGGIQVQTGDVADANASPPTDGEPDENVTAQN